MDVKNNSEILTNFQPMPKRYMVWDSWHNEWLRPFADTNNTDEPAVFDMYSLLCRLDLVKLAVKEKVYKICQSTNLFDKDGKEIFEGSIVEWEKSRWMVFLNQSHLEFVLKPLSIPKMDYLSGLQSMSLKMGPSIKVIGHILSNPELFEEENV